MRISDWSSDVCSSDLARKTDQDAPADIHIKLRYLQARFYGTDAWVERSAAGDEICLITGAAEIDTPGAHQRLDAPRSEEHTSELQSLMRISYAVFCLKKKN